METKPTKTTGRKILAALGVGLFVLYLAASTPAGIRFRDNLVNDLDPKDTYGIPQKAEPTPVDCTVPMGPDYPVWKCYEIPGAYKVSYPEHWTVLADEGPGVFSAGEGDANFSVTYSRTEFMPPEDVAYLISGGADRRITMHAKNLCEQTDVCPKFVGKSTGTIEEEKVTIFQYSMNATAIGHPELTQKQYIMGIARNNTYYQLLLLLPSTMSRDLQAQRVTEFMQMGRSFVIEAKAE